jgi:hypothetical protein
VPAQTDVVLKNLLELHRIESHAERVLVLLAKNHSKKVFDFLGERLTYGVSCGGYEPVPYHFSSASVRTPLSWVFRVRSFFSSS